jgi:hypothetical protein
MQIHRVISAQAINDHTLLVEFDNAEKRQYDVTPLLSKEAFAPLKDPALFKSVEVEKGGYAVIWNSDIDLSEYELWQNGKPMP